MIEIIIKQKFNWISFPKIGYFRKKKEEYSNIKLIIFSNFIKKYYTILSNNFSLQLANIFHHV